MEGDDCDVSGLDGFMRHVEENHTLYVKKPPSIVAVFHVLDGEGNPGNIDGREVILCFQSNGSKHQNVSDICDLFEDMTM